MSTNKNDIYHIGLTDNEVLQSREKNADIIWDTGTERNTLGLEQGPPH